MSAKDPWSCTESVCTCGKGEQCPSLAGGPVNHPKHYNTGSIEVITVIEDWRLGFHEGNAVKYIARAPHKGTQLQDLEKARWYLDRAIAQLKKPGAPCGKLHSDRVRECCLAPQHTGDCIWPEPLHPMATRDWHVTPTACPISEATLEAWEHHDADSRDEALAWLVRREQARDAERARNPLVAYPPIHCYRCKGTRATSGGCQCCYDCKRCLPDAPHCFRCEGKGWYQ